MNIRITDDIHQRLMKHLHCGDGKEAVAFVLCGRAGGTEKPLLLMHELILVPYEDCALRSENRVTWSSGLLPEILNKAATNNLGVVKLHSHPAGGHQFSIHDDESDKLLFPRIYDWLDSDLPHGSLIVTPDGCMTGRVVTRLGNFEPIQSIWLSGNNIQPLHLHSVTTISKIPSFAERVCQTFGEKTFSILQGLKVGVVGCSGTGSPVIEQLVRNCVGELVLVDPDHIDSGNLNRITNSTLQDAQAKTPKVDMHQKAIASIGLGTKVTAIHDDLFQRDVVKVLSECDVIFGCMDSVDGRHLLNKLTSYYLIPYFDVGVKLIADGNGGIDQVCGQTHYLQPGKASLLSRGVYTQEQLEAATMYRTDPEFYQQRQKEGYIDGVNIDKPAVITINTLAASLAVNDLLARLHPYRRGGNQGVDVIRVSLTDMFMTTEPANRPCEMLTAIVGRGDVEPLLNNMELSSKEVGA